MQKVAADDVRTSEDLLVSDVKPVKVKSEHKEEKSSSGSSCNSEAEEEVKEEEEEDKYEPDLDLEADFSQSKPQYVIVTSVNAVSNSHCQTLFTQNI